jgi:hypothetical protein
MMRHGLLESPGLWTEDILHDEDMIRLKLGLICLWFSKEDLENHWKNAQRKRT